MNLWGLFNAKAILVEQQFDIIWPIAVVTREFIHFLRVLVEIERNGAIGIRTRLLHSPAR